jgi:hypothetical protein
VLIQEVHEDARVEIARARAHDEAARGREPHRRVDRAPVLHRGHARPVAEMREHGAAERRRSDGLDDVLVRKAVEAVASYACVEEVARQGEALGDLRQAAMERGVEARHLREARRTRGDGVEDGELRGKMKRREPHERIERGAQHRIDSGGRAVRRSAVNEPMTHGVRRRQRCSTERFERGMKGLDVIGAARLVLEEDAALAVLQRDARVFLADPL